MACIGDITARGRTRPVSKTSPHHRCVCRDVGRRGNQAKDAAADGEIGGAITRHITAGLCAQGPARRAQASSLVRVATQSAHSGVSDPSQLHVRLVKPDRTHRSKRSWRNSSGLHSTVSDACYTCSRCVRVLTRGRDHGLCQGAMQCTRLWHRSCLPSYPSAQGAALHPAPGATQEQAPSYVQGWLDEG